MLTQIWFGVALNRFQPFPEWKITKNGYGALFCCVNLQSGFSEMDGFWTLLAQFQLLIGQKLGKLVVSDNNLTNYYLKSLIWFEHLLGFHQKWFLFGPISYWKWVSLVLKEYCFNRFFPMSFPWCFVTTAFNEEGFSCWWHLNLEEWKKCNISLCFLKTNSLDKGL